MNVYSGGAKAEHKRHLDAEIFVTRIITLAAADWVMRAGVTFILTFGDVGHWQASITLARVRQ